MFSLIGVCEEVVARDVTLERALVIALEYGGTGKAAVVHRDQGVFRCFKIGYRSPHGLASVLPGRRGQAQAQTVPNPERHG